MLAPDFPKDAAWTTVAHSVFWSRDVNLDTWRAQVLAGHPAYLPDSVSRMSTWHFVRFLGAAAASAFQKGCVRETAQSARLTFAIPNRANRQDDRPGLARARCPRPRRGSRRRCAPPLSRRHPWAKLGPASAHTLAGLGLGGIFDIARKWVGWRNLGHVQLRVKMAL